MITRVYQYALVIGMCLPVGLAEQIEEQSASPVTKVGESREPALPAIKPDHQETSQDKVVTVAALLDGQFSGLEQQLTALVEAMPESKFDFAPTNGEFHGVRTFGQQVKHIAASNIVFADALLGHPPQLQPGTRADGPVTVRSKSEILQYLKASFAKAHAALVTVNRDNLTDMLTNPFMGTPMSRLGLASIMTWHSFDHYGQLVVYLRMNGIVPPASAKQ